MKGKDGEQVFRRLEVGDEEEGESALWKRENWLSMCWVTVHVILTEV